MLEAGRRLHFRSFLLVCGNMETKVDLNKEESLAELEVTTSKEDLGPYFREAAQKLTKDKPLKGFRPGKAPVNVVVDTFGKERVLNEALDIAVPKMFVKAVVDNDIDAIDRPQLVIKKADMEEGVSFTAKVDILPKATLGDIKSIKAERKKVEVSDKDVERELNVLAKMRSNYIDVARPAQKGDSVNVDFKVSIDDEVIEGGESKNHPVHIGEGHFVPGFEDKIVGISTGDEREFEIEFSKDYGKKEWAGKKASVWVKANAVQKQVVPEINDEFAKNLGKFDSLDNLKYVIKSNLVQEKEKKEGERLRGEIMEKMVEKSSFTRIPEALIEREIDHRLSDLEQMLAVHKQTVEDYLQKRGKTISEVRESMKPEAEKSVKIGVCLQQFVKDENIEIEDKEVENAANEYLTQYASSKQAKKEVDPKRLKERVRNILLNQKALKVLEEMVGVSSS